MKCSNEAAILHRYENRKEPANGAGTSRILSFGKTGLRGWCSGAIQNAVRFREGAFNASTHTQRPRAPSTGCEGRDRRACPWRVPRNAGTDPHPRAGATAVEPRRDTCSEVLSQFVESGFLSRRANGAFCRASDLAAHAPYGQGGHRVGRRHLSPPCSCLISSRDWDRSWD